MTGIVFFFSKSLCAPCIPSTVECVWWFDCFPLAGAILCALPTSALHSWDHTKLLPPGRCGHWCVQVCGSCGHRCGHMCLQVYGSLWSQVWTHVCAGMWILWLQVWTHVCAGCGSCGHRCECTCVQVYRSCGHRCGCCGLEMLSRTLPLVVCSWVLDTDFPRSPPCTVPAQCFHWPLYSDGDA